MTKTNQVTLTGNLGRAPEFRDFANGGRVCNLRLATTERWHDRQTGEERERTDWHNVAVFSASGLDVCETLETGAFISVVGKLETRKWQDQSGADRYTTEVVVRAPKSHSIARVMKSETPGDAVAEAPASRNASTAPAVQDAPAERELVDEIPF